MDRIVEDRLNETIILRTEGELKLFSRINPDEERIGKTEDRELMTDYCRLPTDDLKHINSTNLLKITL